ncbi:alkaline phosphatase PafA [Frigoriflavimonas asaccharolytica]|uniref:Putative AlkP superfamily pyrophosphatase or phosphodiesterase n=1 Tax=Frigoriflavimonas asaccharolytica TaxID=2735899 RepID=A0A8J8G864_9FLAO|nr:alkaline phosphatase PafA [Frigoriflavimonas asaccharolytica]NRS93238.1 putative AlkP superfamily pyrophosphatase or phosphodiesterase [Frigoriflavimonas asaccharolytica]
MLKKITLLLFAILSTNIFAQKNNSKIESPKLVVGLVIDQMRWDYLYRYYDKYEKGGFKRLLKDGYSLNNVTINYLPTYTAVGHTTIYTGSVPAIHGIAANDWFDKSQDKELYCTSDEEVKTVGSLDEKVGKQSPRNLWSTTITDQLMLGTNFKSKIVGVSLKDRASILPAGHNPTGAFWFDDSTGNFVTSTYYMNTLPKWLQDFNAKNIADDLVKNGWNTLLPISEYTESSADNSEWEGLLGTAKTPTFPYDNLPADYLAKKDNIRYTPFGNTLTLKVAEAALNGEKMGSDNVTDFLAINLASTDYAGHKFGPNSIEVEDVYLRLDRDLAMFFEMLDSKIGKGKYTVFLSADHGGAHSEGFMEAHKMPTGFYGEDAKKNYLKSLKDKFNVEKLISDVANSQVYLNSKEIEKNNLNEAEVKEYLIKQLLKDPTILFAVDMKKIAESSIPEPLKSRIINGYNWQRSGDIQIIYRDSYLPSYSKKGTTHGSWNSYDAHIPLIFMGFGIKKGDSNKEYHMTDIAPTLSALLKIEFPSGNIGKTIDEVLK